jgi:Flp pilus assembly protein TadG
MWLGRHGTAAAAANLAPCQRGRYRDDEGGSLTAFVATLSFALFALVGLAVDGGRAVADRGAASGVAEQAARVGAEQISVGGLRQGVVTIDPFAARAAAERYLAAVGYSGDVATSGDSVTVHVWSSEPTVILGIVGIDRISISASASATNLHGVTKED